MCGFFNAPFCHLVSKKKNFFFEKKKIKQGRGELREGILQILLADIFFSNVFDSTALFIIFSFFSSLIFFMFHQKRNKNQKTTLIKEKKIFLEKKLLYTKKWHRFFHGLARKNNSNNSSNNCVSQQARKFKNVEAKKENRF